MASQATLSNRPLFSAEEDSIRVESLKLQEIGLTGREWRTLALVLSLPYSSVVRFGEQQLGSALAPAPAHPPSMCDYGGNSFPKHAITSTATPAQSIIKEDDGDGAGPPEYKPTPAHEHKSKPSATSTKIPSTSAPVSGMLVAENDDSNTDKVNVRNLSSVLYSHNASRHLCFLRPRMVIG